jgi:hypothetical protein
MTYKGKKYITKIVSSDSCDGCVFADFTKPNICNLKNDNTKCSNEDNEDQQFRVWVEDTSVTKKVKVKEIGKPIQHKMEYKGKKYVTKFVKYGCEGCAFERVEGPCYGIENANDHRCCSRIWVEDKPISKKYETKIIDGFPCKVILTPKEKNHVWVVEYYDKVCGWVINETTLTRRDARRMANELIDYINVKKTRVRKFVPVK